MPGSGKPKNFSFNSLQVGIPAEEATGLIGHFHMDSKMNGVACHSVSITPMMGVKSASNFKSIADHSRMDKVVEASRCQNPDMPGSGKPMIYMTTTEVKKCLTLKKSDPVPLIEDNDDNNDDDSGFFYLSDSDDDDLTSGSVLLGLQFSEDDQLNHSFILEDNPLNGPIDSTFDERIIQIDANLQDIDSLGQTILDEKKRKKLMEDDSFSLEDNPLNGPIDSTFDGKIIQVDADLQDIDSLGQTILDEKKRKKLMEDDSFSLEDNPLNGPIDSTFDGKIIQIDADLQDIDSLGQTILDERKRKKLMEDDSFSLEDNPLNGPIDSTFDGKIIQIDADLQGIDSLGQIIVERKRKKLMEENSIEVDAILEGIDLFVQILVERKKKKNELKKRVFICAILFCIVWFASCFVPMIISSGAPKSISSTVSSSRPNLRRPSLSPSSSASLVPSSIASASKLNSETSAVLRLSPCVDQSGIPTSSNSTSTLSLSPSVEPISIPSTALAPYFQPSSSPSLVPSCIASASKSNSETSVVLRFLPCVDQSGIPTSSNSTSTLSLNSVSFVVGRTVDRMLSSNSTSTLNLSPSLESVSILSASTLKSICTDLVPYVGVSFAVGRTVDTNSIVNTHYSPVHSIYDAAGAILALLVFFGFLYQEQDRTEEEEEEEEEEEKQQQLLGENIGQPQQRKDIDFAGGFDVPSAVPLQRRPDHDEDADQIPPLVPCRRPPQQDEDTDAGQVLPLVPRQRPPQQDEDADQLPPLVPRRRPPQQDEDTDAGQLPSLVPRRRPPQQDEDADADQVPPLVPRQRLPQPDEDADQVPPPVSRQRSPQQDKDADTDQGSPPVPRQRPPDQDEDKAKEDPPEAPPDPDPQQEGPPPVPRQRPPDQDEYGAEADPPEIPPDPDPQEDEDQPDQDEDEPEEQPPEVPPDIDLPPVPRQRQRRPRSCRSDDDGILGSTFIEGRRRSQRLRPLGERLIGSYIDRSTGLRRSARRLIG
jgi:hypothetical protein